jgi:hypothetical protein
MSLGHRGEVRVGRAGALAIVATTISLLSLSGDLAGARPARVPEQAEAQRLVVFETFNQPG